jgi:hypothetical protein
MNQDPSRALYFFGSPVFSLQAEISLVAAHDAPIVLGPGPPKVLLFEKFSRSSSVASRNRLIRILATGVAIGPRIGDETGLWSGQVPLGPRMRAIACYLELPRISLLRRWVNKG